MKISREAAAVVEGLGEKLGLAWQSNTRKTRGTDEVLNICIGDGLAPTKIDGWIHACTLTAKSLVRYANDPNRGLDIVEATSWTGGNSALRYGRWQADFHWKIDTRPWQFFLYMFPMKWAFRSRRFAPHPDPTCGSSWQGYPYRKIWDRDDPSFEELAMPFIEKGKSEYERVEGKVEPKPYPALTNQMESGLPTIAWGWIETAKQRGISDDYLRVRLGDRAVPTRFNGWWASLQEMQRFAGHHADESRAQVDTEDAASTQFELSDYAVRFGLCQAEFQRRLRGSADQLAALIESGQHALVLESEGKKATRVSEFIETAVATAKKALETDAAISDAFLPELNISRPVHPRYAPVDPLEPLPWEVHNPERYLKKMAKLGYTL